MHGLPRDDLTLKVQTNEIAKLTLNQRKEVMTWLASQIDIETAPPYFRPFLTELFDRLTCGRLTQKDFNTYGMQLARALGMIPSSERRKNSTNPLAGLKSSLAKPSKSKREKLEQQREQFSALIDRYDDLKTKHQDKIDRLDKRLKKMSKDPEKPQTEDDIDFDTPVEDIKLSEEQRAKSKAYADEVTERLVSGEGPDPSLQSINETLMNANVISTYEEKVDLPAELPEGISEEEVVKTLTEKRVRYDFSMSVTQLELDVEKKVVVTKDGERKIFSGSTSEIGPPGYSVTWQALVTLAVMIGQFAMPLNRLATMLSTGMKRFTSSGLSRIAHYFAQRFLPIYLELADQLSDSRIWSGDDTTARVLEVSSYFSKLPKNGESPPPPWQPYRTTVEAQETYSLCIKLNEARSKLKEESGRAVDHIPKMEPSLSVLVGRELDFESKRRDGKGPKQSLNTTVLTGRSEMDDPKSLIVFYRTHFGGLGNLLDMLLKRRNPKYSKVTVQSDLSTVNLVTNPELTSRFEIESCGCAAHARRPFALYEDQDKLHAPYMLTLFQGLALHEKLLDNHGRNRENVLAVRGTDSRSLWEDIKALAEKLKKKWSKATPLGTAARYIIKHFKKLTAYLDNPHLEATNNLRERLLRTEKLIEKSSMFRKTIEGRVVLDIIRTILQTAVAADVSVQEYLIDVLKTDPKKVAKNPELYTPKAWASNRPKN